MARPEIEIKLNEAEFLDAIEMLKDMEESIDDKYMKSTIRRKVRPIINDMKISSPSSRLLKVLGVTSAKRKTRGGLIRVGVIKNDRGLFPNISSYGLSAILEYGTEERFRQASRAGFVTGRIPTGSIPKRRYAFLRSSWDTNIKGVQEETIKTVIKRIEKKT